MVSVSTSILTNSIVDMSFSGFVKFGGTLTATSTNFSWASAFTPSSDVDIHGSGFTYSGSSDARELASGTISRISIDVGNDNGSDTSGDLVITATEGLVGSNIDKDNAQSFWNEVLKGDDTFNLFGLGETDVGLGTNIIFSDDLASATSSFSGVTDSGGNDTIFGADNHFKLIGDVYFVGGNTSSPFVVFAEYDAGDDTIVSALTDRDVLMIGDAYRVDPLGTLHGGNDTLDNSNGTGVNSSVVGDTFFQIGGTVNGGDDIIDTDSGAEAGATGDVDHFSGGTLNGGDDVIAVHSTRLSFVAGDVYSVRPDTTSGTINCGSDRIIGSAERDQLMGDIGVRSSTSNTIVAGNDIILGKGGNDSLYGEAYFGELSDVSGGNDRIDGGKGNDSLLGQIGKDRLNGGTGNDQLTGGRDADILIFQPGTGDDHVAAFTDKNGADDDRIDLRAYNFASRGDIGKSASGDDLVLNLSGGDTATIVDYLARHAITDINNDIII